jgi:Dolichyl-phosphate-mannose-protein mannosyltransferase
MIQAVKRLNRRAFIFTLVAAVVVTMARVYVSALSGLGDDEAYYWDWSRRLGLSYFDHPGMVAWLIRISTSIFGQTSFAVRFFALVCNTMTGVVLWLLARRVFNNIAAAIAASFYIFAPIFSLGGVLMVPDAPMGLAWMTVTYLVWRILLEGDERWRMWLLAGVVLGLGLLSKYTIILLAASVVLLMLTEKQWRSQFLRGKFWSAVLIAIIFCLPIILWNTKYDWPTLKYHLHDRQTGGGGANFSRWGQFFVTQLIVLSPALLVLCLLTWYAALKRWEQARWRFLAVMTLPTFLLFCSQALFAEFKPHWSAPAYSVLFIGAAEFLRELWIGYRRTAMLTTALIVLLFIPINLLFYVGSVVPVIPKIARAVAPAAPWEPKFDPTNDLYGWDKAYAEAQKIRAEFRSRGAQEPILSSSRYQLVAQLAFASQERVWRLAPGSDQYGFWQTPEDMQSLLGRDAIYITDQRFERDPNNDHLFKSCTLRPPLLVYRDDELARQFNIWVCQQYLGQQQSH